MLCFKSSIEAKVREYIKKRYKNFRGKINRCCHGRYCTSVQYTKPPNFLKNGETQLQMLESNQLKAKNAQKRWQTLLIANDYKLN